MQKCPACGREAAAQSRLCSGCGSILAPLGGDPTGLYHPQEVTETAATPTPTPPPVDGHRFGAGQILAGRYRIVSRLGVGGMGEVYRADDLRLGQSVALKFLPDEWTHDPQRLAYLHEEVKLSRQISHTNVCRVYDIAEADGHTFISMEFIDGEDLASLLRRIGRLPPDKGVEIARQLCLGLAAAHEKGVIHRDLKPANIMLDGRGHVRVMDFGLARSGLHVTGDDAKLGTPAYMAPEQLTGKEATVKSDIFALGLVLYEVFTGKRAYQAASRAELIRLQEESSPSTPSTHVSGLDPMVERVILRCLEKAPRDRPPSAIAVAAALPGGDPLAAALAAGEMPSPAMVAAAGDSGAWPAHYSIACFVGVLAALLFCVLLYGQGVLLGRTGLPKSTDGLAEHAREVLDKLGFAAGGDSAIGFDHDEDYLRWIRKKDPNPARWDRLSESQPAALFFWYRQSPKPLVPQLYYPYPGTLEPGRITLSEPPPVVPGMVSVKLDLSGRLLEMQAVPPLDDGVSVEWQTLFEQAKLDITQFKETSATQVPPSFADAIKAWTGKSPYGDDLNVTVEAASLRGRPVYFKIVHDRTLYEEEAVGSQGTLDYAASRLLAGLFAAIMLAAAVLGPRNLYRGRADRKGAMRLALWTFVILMFVWVFETHHVLSVTDELRLVTNGLAFALSWTGLLWLTYIALEPYVRQLWPESLITWTRLLSGQWRDPRVGRDILLGVFAGLLVQVLDLLGRTAPAWVGLTTPAPYWDWWIPNTLIRGYWIGNFVINLVYCFRWAFFDRLLVFLVIRVVVRRPLPTAILFTLYQSVHWIGTSAGFQPSLYWLFAALVQVLLAVLLIRVGVLSVIVAIFAWYTVCFPLTTHLTAWHAESTFPVVASMLVLAGYGFYVSLAGQSLLGPFESRDSA